MKKILIVGLALIGLVGTGWVFTERVLATEADAFNQPVVDKLVERFDLNEEEVVGVFDEMHQERQQERQAQMEAGLDDAVAAGVITSDQKQALLDKQAEMQEKHEQLREEMKTWRDESGIDFEALAPYHVGCGGRGFGKMHGFGGF